MKSLRFSNIAICSEGEQKAVRIPFHPKKTLLVGKNSTGKSTILKTLFRTLGAEPTGKLRNWDTRAVSVVDFEVEGARYSALRHGDVRALFHNDKLAGAATSSKHWNEVFADAVDFQLMLIDRAGNFRRAAPSNFFLPFYLNQDGSFQSSWNTFTELKQFQESVTHTLEYFLRVRPPRYFQLRADLQRLSMQLQELWVEITTLSRTRNRLKRAVKAAPVKLNAKDFAAEVHDLTEEANHLAKKQDVLRRDIVQAQELTASLREQVQLSAAALREHSADFKFAGVEARQEHKFVCPTCHAEHDASFHTILELAEDARELLQLKARLEDDLTNVERGLTRKRREASALMERYGHVQSLLSVKRGRVTFQDVIESYSVVTADGLLQKEQAGLESTFAHLRTQETDLRTELRVLEDAHDGDTPRNQFREHFRRFLVSADVVQFDDVDHWRIASRPNESGSGGPRAIVAYYAALWATAAENGTLPSPLVIDSPNQNAQDREHLRRVLAFIANNAPRDAQVILAHEEVAKEFDADLVVQLTEPRSLLSANHYQTLAPRLLAMRDAARELVGSTAAEEDDDQRN